MKYYTLEKQLHATNHEEYEKEYQKRLDSYSTIKFPLFINNQSTQLFAVIKLPYMNKIIKINNLLIDLPLIYTKKKEKTYFYKDYLNKLFNDELIATNEIEGVHTSRKELELALKSNIKNDGEQPRFKFLVKKYQQLINNNTTNLISNDDIKNIYNELLDGEISKTDQCDGLIYRKDGVQVISRTTNNKIVHQGITPESSIILHMNTLLSFINNEDDDINPFIKIAIAHYYLGYIHPFYDGNGRLNRYISSYLINKYSHNLLSLKISKVIKDNINAYDKAFITTSNIINKGEATFFVEMFIDILYEAALQINEDLSIYQNKLNNYYSQIKTYSDLNENEIITLKIIYQAFILDNDLKVNQLAKSSKLSEYKIRIILKNLDKKGYISYQTRGRIIFNDIQKN